MDHPVRRADRPGCSGPVHPGPPTEIDVKGKRLPVQALPLLGRAAEAALSRFPLIGRDDDLAQLELVARRAFTDRRPFLVSLIAPAGTGKTRLVEEFLHRLPALSPDATVAIAQCLPYGQRVTYWPLRALLVRLVGLKEEAAPGPCARRSGSGFRPRRRIARACGRPSRRDDRRR